MGRDEFWDWRLRSKCANMSLSDYDNQFFPSGGRVSNKQKEFCKDCPVIKLCLKYALDTDADGIWAGTSRNDRLAMKRFTALASKPKPKVVKRKDFVFN